MNIRFADSPYFDLDFWVTRKMPPNGRNDPLTRKGSKYVVSTAPPVRRNLFGPPGKDLLHS